MENEEDKELNSRTVAFKRVVEYLKKADGSLKLSQKNLLKLYGYFKQATVGNCTGSRPNVFKMKERAKYDAWKECANMPKSEAMHKYVEYANEHIPSLKMHVSL